MSFLAELRAGRFRWDLIHPFPQQDPADRTLGAAAAAELLDLLTGVVDPDELDRTRRLPPDLIPALRAKGYLAMTVPQADGGLGLSPFNTFRLLETASTWSASVGMLLSWQNTLGIGAYLEMIPPGPLRDLVVARVADGAVLGFADSEPGGAANATRSTVAVPTEGGYLLTGEKLFTGNASVADLLTVSATVWMPDGGERIDMFLVDTTRDGFTVIGVHDLVGLNGSPLAAVRLDRVFVPAEHVIVPSGHGFRASPLVARLTAIARMFITVTPPLAAARSCLAWSREFLGRRRVNGRPLAGYDSIQRRLAASLADVFAIDSVVRWCLLGHHAAMLPGGTPVPERLPELTSAKNIGTVTAWRVIERTMSLLGGEGAETAPSKARRGASPLPVEQAWRDARSLRIAGGVDFNIDMRSAWSGIFSPIYDGQVDPARPTAGCPSTGRGAATPSTGRGAADSGTAKLSAANRRNLQFVRSQTAVLRSRCLELAGGSPADQLAERQEVLITINRLADELFTMSVVLARAASLADRQAQDLAAVFCAGARTRIRSLWSALDAVDEVDHATPCRAWLNGDLAGLLVDVEH